MKFPLLGTAHLDLLLFAAFFRWDVPRPGVSHAKRKENEMRSGYRLLLALSIDVCAGHHFGGLRSSHAARI
jgi:hypothetical protein